MDASVINLSQNGECEIVYCIFGIGQVYEIRDDMVLFNIVIIVENLLFNISDTKNNVLACIYFSNCTLIRIY